MISEKFALGGQMIEVWPAAQALHVLGDPAIRVTTFADTAAYHPGLVARLLAAEQDRKQGVRYGMSGGGTKVHALHQLGWPEIDFLSARAAAMCKRMLNLPQVVIDSSWANIYRRGDYIMPHSHVRATASIVYCVEPGDPDPVNKDAGLFCFIDPRLDASCPERKGFFTKPLAPFFEPGTMMVFPGQLTHFVTPYMGERPRITLSWNFNPHALPGSPLDVGKQRFVDEAPVPTKA